MKGLTVPFYFYRCGIRERSKGIVETRFVGKKVVCFIKPTSITRKKKKKKKICFQTQSFFRSETEETKTKGWKN